MSPVKIGSVEVGPKANPGEGRARRCYISPDKLSDTPGDGVTVIYDILQRSARLYPNKDALGWRDVVRMIDEVKEVEKMIGGEKVSPLLQFPPPLPICFPSF
jgi:long-chain acyl-CoA synthetase